MKAHLYLMGGHQFFHSDYITDSDLGSKSIGIARRFIISTNRCTGNKELQPQPFQAALKNLVSP